jgi:predicted phage baseplate assembly protein
VLEVLAPAGFTKRLELGMERYWLRCRSEAGSFAFESRLRRVLLNTVMATHAATILDETLGSSDGGQNQRFVTTRRPVLHGQEELRVREPDLPAADERNAAGGDDAIAVTRDAGGQPIEIWVRWREVQDFYGSGPRDRHYVLDHVTGTISFGDGVNGMVPLPGVGNLRLTRYRTGGGSAGNCAPGTIVQLKTTIPYVDKVTNPEPARGGADAETTQSLRERGPRTIRHRDRAVTIEDYEDLAMLASPEVARAKCVPLYDLSTDPDAKGKPLPGTVSMIIVPRSIEARPLPSRALLERIAEHLDARRLPVVDLKIVSPHYVQVDIVAKVALTSIDRASEIQALVVDALRRFLHPLTGGFDAAGWDFGRKPQDSDVLQCIGEISGVDHVRSLQVKTPDQPDNEKTLALVFAGSIEITVAAGDA